VVAIVAALVSSGDFIRIAVPIQKLATVIFTNCS